MRTRLGRALLAWLPIAGLVLAVLVGTPSTSQAQVRVGGTLQVSPKTFVAGQALTFAGTLPHRGRQRIRLQFNMNRPGDAWTTVDGFSTVTNTKGAFRFTHPAPAMFNISYRVIGGRYATKGVKLAAKSQEVVLSFYSADTGNLLDSLLGLDLPGAVDAVASVASGRALVVVADTAARVTNRADAGPPPLPGRKVDLQQRVGGAWKTVASSRSDTRGLARFRLTGPAPGEAVYRARLGDYHAGGSDIGWFPGFPTYVKVTS